MIKYENLFTNQKYSDKSKKCLKINSKFFSTEMCKRYHLFVGAQITTVFMFILFFYFIFIFFENRFHKDSY